MYELKYLDHCADCPVAAGKPCYGPCGWAANPDLVGRVVERAGLPPPSVVPMTRPPLLLAKAVNLAGAVASHVAAGMPTLSDDATDARLAVCRDPDDNSPRCDQYLPSGSCLKCGCNLAVKASWAGMSCPLGKWPGDGMTTTATAIDEH